MHSALNFYVTDAEGNWQKGPVGLGHLMLWNTPESLQESLPLALNEEGHQLVITADARLDNREQLYSQLEVSGPINAISDSYLMLQQNLNR